MQNFVYVQAVSSKFILFTKHTNGTYLLGEKLSEFSTKIQYVKNINIIMLDSRQDNTVKEYTKKPVL